MTYLRSSAGWSKTRLAQALGLSEESLLSAYERGAKPLTREQLEALIEPLGHPPEAVDVFLATHDLIYQEVKGLPSPVTLTLEERRIIGRAAMAAAGTAGRIAAEIIQVELTRKRSQETIELAKQVAEDLFQRLSTLAPQERRGLIEIFPEYWNWALAVRVCEASVRSTAHNLGEALELAELAVLITERISGKDCITRLKGYCLAHVANALRVANDHSGAEEVFARAWRSWREPATCDLEFLPEWVLPSMEASLCCDQRRFSEALELLERAKNSRGGTSPTASVFLLLQKDHIFQEMGDPESALAALEEAAPLIEEQGDARKAFALRFNMADNLLQLQRYQEAAGLLPEVRKLAAGQANELDLLRLVWLESKLAAGQGRLQVAIAGLEQVAQDFTTRKMPYDAALSSLDLSMLYMEAGRTEEVRRVAIAVGWIFKEKGMDREALVALRLFCEAAKQEIATIELARRVSTQIEQTRRLAPPLAELD